MDVFADAKKMGVEMDAKTDAKMDPYERPYTAMDLHGHDHGCPWTCLWTILDLREPSIRASKKSQIMYKTPYVEHTCMQTGKQVEVPATLGWSYDGKRSRADQSHGIPDRLVRDKIQTSPRNPAHPKVS